MCCVVDCSIEHPRLHRVRVKVLYNMEPNRSQYNPLHRCYLKSLSEKIYGKWDSAN